MKYRELLRLYKDGKLDGKEQKRVENDIDRQEAISEYLFEKEVPELEKLKEEGDGASDAAGRIPGEESVSVSDIPGSESSRAVAEAADFTLSVRKTIRRAFAKAGLVVGAILLAILLLIQFALPKLVSSFYYDPTKMVSKSTNQMTLDMYVYSELFLPLHLVTSVPAEAKGYGKYEISMLQGSYGLGNNPIAVSGTLTRNKLRFYQPDALSVLWANAFEWSSGDLDGKKSLKQQIKNTTPDNSYNSFGGSPDMALDTIRGLPDVSAAYMAVVNPNRILTFKQAEKFANGRPFWAAVWNGDNEEYENAGFLSNNIGSFDSSLNVKGYSLLTADQIYKQFTKRKDQLTEQDYATHFLSALRYMKNQETFESMMDCSVPADMYEAYKDYIDRNGLQIYGMVMMLTKEEMLSMMKDEAVYSIGVYQGK